MRMLGTPCPQLLTCFSSNIKNSVSYLKKKKKIISLGLKKKRLGVRII